MENIILQLSLELSEKIVNKTKANGIRDIDDLATDLLEDCTAAAREILVIILEHMNVQMREDKSGRKKQGLVLHQKERPRELFTALGQIKWNRDYYYNKDSDKYCAPLDDMIGVRKYERLGDCVSAELINHAAAVSYAKSADIVTKGKVSRQTVRNKLLKLDVPDAEVDNEKKAVKELHVYADEDHVHMQKPRKKRGKENQIVPLVTVTEGTRNVSHGRNETINPAHFVDENFSSKNLWKSVEGYIDKAYNIAEIEKIYVHGDGGKWIQNGLDIFPQTEYVIDGYHFFKALKGLSRNFPTRKVRQVITSALRSDDSGLADSFLYELWQTALTEAERESANSFASYLFAHWRAIRRRVMENLPGSCSEGQVSHVLSARFSRNPMGWSKAGLGKLSKVRVCIENGRCITSRDMKPESKSESYSEYADRMIEEYVSGQLDWSIFEPYQATFDGASGTQYAIRKVGQCRDMFS